jgi:hypothetical protein
MAAAALSCFALLKMDGIALGIVGLDLLAVPIMIAILIFRHKKK